MKVQMKPETIERRRKEREVMVAERRVALIRRLEAKAQLDPDGDWLTVIAEIKANR